jgi:hypothetical protein
VAPKYRIPPGLSPCPQKSQCVQHLVHHGGEADVRPQLDRGAVRREVSAAEQAEVAGVVRRLDEDVPVRDTFHELVGARGHHVPVPLGLLEEGIEPAGPRRRTVDRVDNDRPGPPRNWPVVCRAIGLLARRSRVDHLARQVPVKLRRPHQPQQLLLAVAHLDPGPQSGVPRGGHGDGAQPSEGGLHPEPPVGACRDLLPCFLEGDDGTAHGGAADLRDPAVQGGWGASPARTGSRPAACSEGEDCCACQDDPLLAHLHTSTHALPSLVVTTRAIIP